VEYGVYYKKDCEITVSERFCLLLLNDGGVFGARLFHDGKLIAACEHHSGRRETSYAFLNDKGEAVANSEANYGLGTVMGVDEIIAPYADGLLKKDDIRIIPAETKMPAVYEKGTAYCLKHWKLGNQLNVFEDSINFTMNTNKIEYIMMLRKPNDDIYCGASVTIPYDHGLFGGGQYFRIRNYADNSQPWCQFHCSLGNKAVLPEFQVPECSTGSCILTKDGYFWEIKRHTDDEIVLQGCGDDEYFYYRDTYMTERFFL